MGRPARWSLEPTKKGVAICKLSSWKYFSDYVNQELLDYTSYVFRGHADSLWKLEPTLDRVIKNPESSKRSLHLENFKYEVRGRRGPNPSIMQDENDWWALGQHHGLHTPLLDWTESPFVALYFAASNAHKLRTNSLAVFAFFQHSANVFNNAITNDPNVALVNDRKPTVKIVKPLSDENRRLVSQRGLFTRGPNNMDIESWVNKYNTYKGGEMSLIKIIIPNSGIQDCLRYLNRMNINHSTLFPDLSGASDYCNKHLTINKY